MSVLAQFRTPGLLPEPSETERAAWSAQLAEMFAKFTANFPQLYDPTVNDTPESADVVDIVWTAFPAQLLRGATSQEGRWAEADGHRDKQDEYCEWSVERNADGDITRVTFTSEVPEYFEHMARDPERLAKTYSELVGQSVAPDDVSKDGHFIRENKWNQSGEGRLAHLFQGNNTLEAAVALVAEATVPRERNGKPITSKQVLATCAGLGNPFRNSDPQIAAGVNAAARAGNELTLQDPLGLYIDGLITTGMATPDNTDPAEFWTVERGGPGQAVRARYEVPPKHGYTVSQVTSDGRPITFGAQLADRVRVRISAVLKPAHHQPQAKPCE